MNGLELVKSIRQWGNNVPIITVTTEAEKSQVVEAVQAEINDDLIKPFTPDALSQKIREVSGG